MSEVPRFMGTVITLAFGGTCIYMGYVQNALMLGIGFFAIRMFGQGSLSIKYLHKCDQPVVGPPTWASVGFSGLAMALLGVGAFSQPDQLAYPPLWSAARRLYVAGQHIGNPYGATGLAFSAQSARGMSPSIARPSATSA